MHSLESNPSLHTHTHTGGFTATLFNLSNKNICVLSKRAEQPELNTITDLRPVRTDSRRLHFAVHTGVWFKRLSERDLDSHLCRQKIIYLSLSFRFIKKSYVCRKNPGIDVNGPCRNSSSPPWKHTTRSDKAFRTHCAQVKHLIFQEWLGTAL